MTGEITLRGEVTAIGGLKEKLLAALRGGIRTVLIPEENAKDLQDIPENVKSGLEIVPVKWIDQVLEVALERRPTPLTDDDRRHAGPGAEIRRAARDDGGVDQALRRARTFCKLLKVDLPKSRNPVYTLGLTTRE